MPHTSLFLYRDKPSQPAPLSVWLAELEKNEPESHIKAIAAISDLEAFGYELRRPTADFLRDSIYELRWRYKKKQFRILYCFIGRNSAVMTHGFYKPNSAVNDVEIDRAIAMKARVENDSKKHLTPW